MNRYMVWFMMALLVTTAGPAAGQVGGHVEYRNGRVGVDLAVGGIHVRVASPGPRIRNRVAVRRAPDRIRTDSRRGYWNNHLVQRKELRYLLGKDQVKAIERHARSVGARGRTLGRWLRADGWARVLEVTVGGMAVAELVDYRNDGFFDEMVFLRPRW